MDNIGSIGQLFGLCKAILVTGENVALRFLCSVIAACRLEINLELRTDFRGFDLGFSVVGMLDDGDVAFDNLFSHIIGGVVQLDLIQFRLRTYLVNSGIQQIPLAGVDFTNRPVGITDIIIRGKLTVLIGGIAVDKGVALIKPIGGSGKRTVALGRAGFHIALSYCDTELFQHIVHALVCDFVPGNRGTLSLRHHIANRRINLLQHEVGADEDVFKPRHTAGVGHSVFIHRQAGKRSSIEMEGHSLHQTVLAGLCDLQTAALQHVVKVHGGRLAADDGHALSSLGFVFVDGLLGDGINTGIEVGDVDFARRIGGLGGAVSLAGDREGDALYFAVLGSFDQLHVAGFDFQIEIAHHLVGNGSSIGGEVLRTTTGYTVRPDHNAAALGGDLLRFHRHRTFDGLIGCDGKLVAVHRKVQAGGAAGKGVITQHIVGVRQGNGILLAIPFQFISSSIRGTAEKAGQHGVALYGALNGGILAENLAAQRMTAADIFGHVVFPLSIGIHMVKLAITLTDNRFPNKKLGSDIARHLIGIIGIVAVPRSIGVALPAVGHDPSDIFLDGAGRNGGVQMGRIVVPEILAPARVLVAGFHTDTRLNAIDGLAVVSVLCMNRKTVIGLRRPAAQKAHVRVAPSGFIGIAGTGNIHHIGGHGFACGKGRDARSGEHSKTHQKRQEQGQRLFQCFHLVTS